jgi:Flp pilus assembly pilin Flp
MEKLQTLFLERYVALKNDPEAGQGMVEYALILFLISVVSLGILAAIGVDVKGAYDSVENAINGSQAT